jgi:DNA-binding MarR family transcriptional regulator
MLKRRTLKSGPESKFLSEALANGLMQSNIFSKTVFRELMLPTGIPDAVVVYQNRIQLNRSVPSRKLSTIHLQVLAHLYDIGQTTMDELITALIIPKSSLEKILQKLANANLVDLRHGRVHSRSLKKVFAFERIIAIEAKLQNWRKALAQAAANFWFASHSYVLLPPLRCLAEILKEAKKLGVGVFIFDGKKTTLVSKPKQQRLPVSYGSWLIHEWAIQRCARRMR